ncbi:MAG: class I SAM-dependent methyltransferase [Chloroflexota bacterium]
MSERSTEDFGAGFHDKLSTFWPHPREQLHHGGWETTHWLFEYLDVQPDAVMLDYCCGEGGTSNWAAQSYANQIIGLDIVTQAVQVARSQAPATNAPLYLAADGFAIPLANNTVDIIYGQDPDVLGYHTRQSALAECARVLRPAGQFVFHHYALHDAAPTDVKTRFNSINAELGFSAFGRLTVAEYIADIQSVGLEVVATHDMSAVYQTHMTQMRDIATERGETLDIWTSYVLDLMESGIKVGMFFDTRKSQN